MYRKYTRVRHNDFTAHGQVGPTAARRGCPAAVAVMMMMMMMWLCSDSVLACAPQPTAPAGDAQQDNDPW
jgi:hypothetical protein